MPKIGCLIFLIFFFTKLFGQTGTSAISNASNKPLPIRQVSGIIRDETKQPLKGAVIFLKSANDSLTTLSDENGVFLFREVKEPIFYITVTEANMISSTRKYLNNDMAKKIVLNPIDLQPYINVLKEVKIDGRPSIVYKTDTIEYKASDYHVRENATVDELLKKMEGMEVGKDGSLTYQGQDIKKAKLNGKTFAGGDVAQVIQSLPADIIEKAQIIDDYGDLAARTGIKDGPATKILNLTTQANKSVGTYGRLLTQGGSNKRYNVQTTILNLNANRTISLLGKFNNTINGIANDVNSIGTSGPGTTTSGSPAFSYRDQWSKKVEVLINYSYRYNKNETINKSFGENYSYGINDSIRNTSKFNRYSITHNDTKGHLLSMDLDYFLNSANYLKLSPTINLSNRNGDNNSLTDNINKFISGFEHPVIKNSINNTNKTDNYGISIFYQHQFEKKGRNFSLQAGFQYANNRTNGDVNTENKYFADSTSNLMIKDSTAHLLTSRLNKSNNYNFAATYTEPITMVSQVDFTGKFFSSSNNNAATSDSVTTGNRVIQLHRLDNIFNYNYTEARFTVNYTYKGNKSNLVIGASAIPTGLAGDKVDNNSGEIAKTNRRDFRLIPVFRFSYVWSQTEKLSLTYSGTNTIPDFQQLQPFIDKSDPNNIYVGNPDLKATFSHNIEIAYNKYIPNSKITYLANITMSQYRDRVTTNIIQYHELISVNPNRYKTINEYNFVNVNGTESVTGNYSISKQLSNNSLSLKGTIKYNLDEAMSNNILFHTTGWYVNERLGPRLFFNDNLEIDPYIGYDLYRTFTSLPGATATSLQKTLLALDGRLNVLKTLSINYSATKSYVTGLGSLNTNPLVIDAGFEKQFLSKKNFYVTFNAYDLLHQNNFILQTVTPQGVTNTFSNSTSRYFLVGLKLILQKWGGAPKRDGKTLKRKGDGSFIY